MNDIVYLTFADTGDSPRKVLLPAGEAHSRKQAAAQRQVAVRGEKVSRAVTFRRVNGVMENTPYKVTLRAGRT